MLNFLLKRIEQKHAGNQRTKIGILAGILGLISNIILFVGKFIIGITANSVSIMADAINNLSDTASSFLTLIGFHIASKPADREHPYGHERFEYISGFVVSLLVTFVGFQFLKDSIEKIRHPENIRLSSMLFIVLILSVLLKLWQGKMYLTLGKKIDSTTLKATSQDSLNDVITTLAVLFSAFIELLTGWRIDGYVGFLIALYILYTGVTMIKSFIDELMGPRPTDEEIRTMENRLASYQTILGYHDLLIHSYGPQKRFASVHIEIDETWSLNEAHRVIDAIEQEFQEVLGVNLVCHLDPVPIRSEEYRILLNQLKRILVSIDNSVRMHDFRVKEDVLEFDLVIPKTSVFTDVQLQRLIEEKVRVLIGDYQLNITFDHIYLL